jgi:hypothetical protein
VWHSRTSQGGLHPQADTRDRSSNSHTCGARSLRRGSTLSCVHTRHPQACTHRSPRHRRLAASPAVSWFSSADGGWLKRRLHSSELAQRRQARLGLTSWLLGPPSLPCHHLPQAHSPGGCGVEEESRPLQQRRRRSQPPAAIGEGTVCGGLSPRFCARSARAPLLMPCWLGAGGARWCCLRVVEEVVLAVAGKGTKKGRMRTAASSCERMRSNLYSESCGRGGCCLRRCGCCVLTQEWVLPGSTAAAAGAPLAPAPASSEGGLLPPALRLLPGLTAAATGQLCRQPICVLRQLAAAPVTSETGAPRRRA